MQYFNEGRLVVKSWCEEPESGAIEQAVNLANHPKAYHHIALMPDTHQGYGMPIGGILAAVNAVIPNAVGVDIGCGMVALKTSIPVGDISTEKLKAVMGAMRKAIPVGFAHHQHAQDDRYMPEYSGVLDADCPIVSQQYSKALKQVGTLGGGNHFIEIQKGSDGFIWVMIHSGSRNLGKQVADAYNKVAKDLNEKWCASVPLSWDLAFLPVDSSEGQSYLREMQYCLDFAYCNRYLMMQRVTAILWDMFSAEITFDEAINIHHNYAVIEHHFGKNVWIHRKGATSARENELGIIPGSQGSKSYIVKGKGSPESFMSCSHGAGRAMSRKKARETLNLADEIAHMESRGIIHGMRSAKELDEAASAYKDIDTVMREQQDLVDIVVELEPMAVIKG